jgi:hypothetical protein
MLAVGSRFPFLLAFWALVAMGVGCSSTPTQDDHGRSDIPNEGPVPGPLEEQLRQYIIDITELLLIDNEDPQETVMSVGRYLDTHQHEIRETARQVRQRVEQMNTAERTFYEELFSDFFVETTRRWYTTLDQFRAIHPDQALTIDGLMVRFD